MLEKAVQQIKDFRSQCLERLEKSLNQKDFVVYFKNTTISIEYLNHERFVSYKVEPQLFSRLDASYLCKNILRNGERPIMGTHEKYLLDCIAECDQLLNSI